MWAFKIVCIAGFWNCFFSGDQTNYLMNEETEERCLTTGEWVAQQRGLKSDKWEVICYPTASYAKRRQK